MGLVHSLGYVVISAENLVGWERFASDYLGLQKGTQEDAERATLFLRTDERSWRLAVEQGPDGGLVALGFELASRASMGALQENLEKAGYPVKIAPELAKQRHVTSVMTTSDPNGVQVEFYYGAKTDQQNFVSPTGACFVTGQQGFGHAVLNVKDADEAYRFYADVLAFRETDLIAMGPFRLSFLSPSPRHHSIAYSQVPPGHAGSVLHHIMLEVDDLDTVGRALDRCLDDQVPIMAMLGKHTNDHMISFYCTTPSGLAVEYGWNGRQIDDRTHVTGYYDTGSYWGHRRLDGSDPVAEIKRALEEDSEQ